MENTIRTRTWSRGEKARTIYGKIVTVCEQVGSVVYVYEGPLDWHHVTKLFPLNSADTTTRARNETEQ